MTYRQRIRDPRPLPPLQFPEHQLPYPSSGEILFIAIALGISIGLSLFAIFNAMMGG